MFFKLLVISLGQVNTTPSYLFHFPVYLEDLKLPVALTFNDEGVFGVIYMSCGYILLLRCFQIIIGVNMSMLFRSLCFCLCIATTYTDIHRPSI